MFPTFPLISARHAALSMLPPPFNASSISFNRFFIRTERFMFSHRDENMASVPRFFFCSRFFALISFHSLTLYRATDVAISTSNETMKTNCRRDTSYQLVIEFSLSQFPCRYPGLLKGSPYSLSTTAIDGGLASIDLSKETD